MSAYARASARRSSQSVSKRAESAKKSRGCSNSASSSQKYKGDRGGGGGGGGNRRRDNDFEDEDEFGGLGLSQIPLSQASDVLYPTLSQVLGGASSGRGRDGWRDGVCVEGESKSDNRGNVACAGMRTHCTMHTLSSHNHTYKHTVVVCGAVLVAAYQLGAMLGRGTVGECHEPDHRQRQHQQCGVPQHAARQWHSPPLPPDPRAAAHNSGPA